MGACAAGVFVELDGQRYHFLVCGSRLFCWATLSDDNRDGLACLNSYLSPILRSVGIAKPVQITLINAGLGKQNLWGNLAIYPGAPADSVHSYLEPDYRKYCRRQCRSVRASPSVLDLGGGDASRLCHHHGPLCWLRHVQEYSHRDRGRSVSFHVSTSTPGYDGVAHAEIMLDDLVTLVSTTSRSHLYPSRIRSRSCLTIFEVRAWHCSPRPRRSEMRSINLSIPSLWELSAGNSEFSVHGDPRALSHS